MDYITRLNDNPSLPFVRYKVKGRGTPLKEAIQKTIYQEREDYGTINNDERFIYFVRNDIQVKIVIYEHGIRYGEIFETWNDGLIQKATEYVYLNI